MIMSPTATKALGDELRAPTPVCVGPFKFAKRVPQNSHRAGQGPELLRRRQGPPGQDRLPDHHRRRASAPPTCAPATSRSRTPCRPRTSRRSSKERRCSVLQSQSLGYQGVTFNIGNVDGVGNPAGTIDRPEAKDPRVRQAFEYAIDRAGLVKVVFNDRTPWPARRSRRRASSAPPAVQECTPHDPAKAKQLLDAGGRHDAVQDHDADLQQPRQPAAGPGAAVDGQGGRVRPQDQAGGVRRAARPAGPRRLRAAAARLVRPGRPRRQHHQLRRHRRQPERRRLQQPDRGRAARPGPRGRRTSRQRKDLYGQVVAKLHQDDPLIYLYRQRNLTGVSNTVRASRSSRTAWSGSAFAGFGEVTPRAPLPAATGLAVAGHAGAGHGRRVPRGAGPARRPGPGPGR